MAPRRSGRRATRSGTSEEGSRIERTPDGVGFLSVYKGAYVYDSGLQEEVEEEEVDITQIDDDDDNDLLPVIVEEEIEEQEENGEPTIAVKITRRMRASIGNTREKVRFALETSRDVLMQTPQRVRNWRRLSIAENVETRKNKDTSSNGFSLDFESLIEDSRNRNVMILLFLLLVAMVTYSLFFPYARKIVDPAKAYQRMAQVRDTFTEPFARLSRRIVDLLSNVHTQNGSNIERAKATFPQFPKLHLSMPKIQLPSITLPQVTLPQISLPKLSSPTVRLPTLRTPDFVHRASLTVGKSLSSVSNSAVSTINSIGSFAAGAATSTAMVFVSIWSNTRSKVMNVANYVSDKAQFVSREEFMSAFDDAKEAMTIEDLEDRIKRFIAEERQQIRESMAKAKDKTKALRAEVVAELRERGEKAADTLEHVKDSFMTGAGTFQLKQREVLREVKSSLSRAFELPAERFTEAKDATFEGLQSAQLKLESSSNALRDEVNAFISKEEDKIREEMADIRATLSSTSEAAVNELLVRKERALNGLRRSRDSIGRMTTLWQEKQKKQIEDIQTSLAPALERARSRPRYVLRGEIDNAVRRLKEGMSFDDIEDQVLKLLLDEAKQVNAKLIARQKLTREQLTMEVLERVVADKGGRPDFALMSAGAYIVSASPSVLQQYAYALKDRFLALIGQFNSDFVLGFPNSPTMAIMPETTLGKCWGFQGQEGNLTVHLARPAIVDAFTVEHAPRSSVFSMLSAPRIIRVYGYPAEIARLADATPADEFFFGELEYSIDDGEYHMQYFEISDEYKVQRPTRAVRIEIVSNHGDDFTCLYRIRVHGTDA